MNGASKKKTVVVSFLAALAGTVVGGIVLFHYQYFYLKGTSDYAFPRSMQFWKEKRTITVVPFHKWSEFVLFGRERYYKSFRIRLYGGDVGFPPETAIQITASEGRMVNLRGPEAIKPTFADGESAVNWTDEKYRESIKTVFVAGPNAGVHASIHVVLMVKGTEVPDNALKVFVSPPGSKPVDVDYYTDVKWSSNN